MGIPVFRVMLHFGLVLLILSLFTLAWVRPDSPAFVPAILALAANVITVLGSWLVLRKLLSSKRH